MNPTVIVKVSGGVVQGTVTNVPGLEVLVLDYDVEGCDEADLKAFPEKGGEEDYADVQYETPLFDTNYARQLVQIAESCSTKPHP